MQVSEKQTVLFIGDSVTDCCRNYSDPKHLGTGYVKKIADWFSAEYAQLHLNFINRGINGNRVCDLKQRWTTDCLDLKPDFLSVLIGINDTWRLYDNNIETTEEAFYNIYAEIISVFKNQNPNSKILIIEPFLLPSMEERLIWRADLDPKIHMVRKIAREFADFFIPMDGIFAEKLLNLQPWEIAGDCVHPSDIGNTIIANECIKILTK